MPAVQQAEAKPKVAPHPTRAERAARGKQARAVTPRAEQGDWAAASDRPDPVALLEEQAALASSAEAFADQNERAHSALRDAVAAGRVAAETGF